MTEPREPTLKQWKRRAAELTRFGPVQKGLFE